MPVNPASRSIGFPDNLAENHNVQFVVHSRLIVPDVEQLNEHLGDHLRSMKSLSDKAILPISGPFFTQTARTPAMAFMSFGWKTSRKHTILRPKILSTKRESELPVLNPGCRSLLDLAACCMTYRSQDGGVILFEAEPVKDIEVMIDSFHLMKATLGDRSPSSLEDAASVPPESLYSLIARSKWALQATHVTSRSGSLFPRDAPRQRIKY